LPGDHTTRDASLHAMAKPEEILCSIYLHLAKPVTAMRHGMSADSDSNSSVVGHYTFLWIHRLQWRHLVFVLV
jgi:hypothetical protein